MLKARADDSRVSQAANRGAAWARPGSGAGGREGSAQRGFTRGHKRMGGTAGTSCHGRRRAPGPQEAPDDQIQTGEDHARTATYALALHGHFANINGGVNHLKA